MPRILTAAGSALHPSLLSRSVSAIGSLFHWRDLAKKMSVQSQLGRHSVAIISLCVALTALGYNTWRNEQTEQNRNIRQAGFEMLLHISELQRVSYLAHYDQDKQGGNPRKGWAEVLVLRDLAELMPASSQAHADSLHQVWSHHWADLDKNDQSVAAIDAAIDELRADVVREIAALD